MKISNNAVSEVVSTLMTLSIVLGVVTAVLFWGLPYIEEKEIMGESQTVFGGFDIMYNTMRGLIIDGYGAKGVSNVVSTNKEASLNIDSQGSKLILMYTFPDSPYTPKDFDFNVSGLDNETNTFTIEAETLGLIDGVQIYWLDPGETTEQLAFETTPYKKIYQNTWCAQSFTPPNDNWELDKVKIYVEERGVVSSDLNVSIYTGGIPNNLLASVIVPSEDISSSYEWIECDFSSHNIQLDITKIYHIGINTSGGSFANGSYNYYKWYLDKDSPYSSYYSSCGANTTTDGGSSWYPVPGYDLGYRIKYIDDTTPNTPEFITPLPSFYSGVNESISVKAVDPTNNDDISYRIFWGDGGISDSGLQPNNTWYNGFKHIYAKPGTYTLTLQAKDKNETIYEPDNITEIHVQTGDYLPEDSYHAESPDVTDNVGPPHTWTITTQNDRPLSGTLRIDLFNNIYPAGGLRGYVPFGRIWVFDLGSITYESRHDMGTQKIIFENGGILLFGPISNSIKSGPSFFEEDEGNGAIGFRIIQIGESYVACAGGARIYELGLNMKNSYSREPKFSNIYNFKMQIYDSLKEVKDLWINYFTMSYDFEKIQDRPNTIYYQTDGTSFVLDSSFIEVNIGGVR